MTVTVESVAITVAVATCSLNLNFVNCSFIHFLFSVYLVDIYNIIEAFRENGLNTLDSKDEIDEPRLECIVASIYYSLYKRLPAKQDIDVEKCILILTQWIMHAFDKYVFILTLLLLAGRALNIVKWAYILYRGKKISFS